VPEPPVKPPVPAAILTCETCGDEFEWFRRTTGQKEPRTCPSCAKAAPNTAQARRRAKEAEAKREEADA
jgi:DNA replicative helicase MCM subunit Mcm2 (Cdc46/Mcm family)